MANNISIFSDEFNERINSFKKEMSSFIDKFDFSTINSEVKEMQSRVASSIKKIKKRFSETDTDFTINVPYDRNDETLSVFIENNLFKAEVKSEDGSSEHTISITIPENVNSNSAVRTYDENSNIMYFKFTKRNVSESELSEDIERDNSDEENIESETI